MLVAGRNFAGVVKTMLNDLQPWPRPLHFAQHPASDISGGMATDLLDRHTA
jgi:hypothetical protein